MELSVAIARIIGGLYLISGIALLLHKSMYTSLVKSIKKSLSALYVAGILSFTFGLIIVTLHNVWVSDWEVIITIIGWLAMVKGCVFLLFPKFAKMQIISFDSNVGRVVGSSFAVILGYILIFAGFSLR